MKFGSNDLGHTRSIFSDIIIFLSLITLLKILITRSIGFPDVGAFKSIIFPWNGRP